MELYLGTPLSPGVTGCGPFQAFLLQPLWILGLQGGPSSAQEALAS